MSSWSPWWTLLASFAITSLLLPVVWWVLQRRKILDVPNGRSSHSTPTPRGAGIAQLGGVLGSLVGAGLPGGLLVGVVGFSLLGAVDDVRSSPAGVRLLGQIVLSILAVILLALQGTIGMTVVLALASAAILVVMVNSSNFMDGINGISAVHGIVFGVFFSILLEDSSSDHWGLLGLALAGASLAFLPWNWRAQARMFLGDSGSYLLGAATGLLVIGAWASGTNPVVALAPVTIYVVDVLATLLERINRGEHLATAHRDHAYQQLITLGWSHRWTTIFVASLSAACGLLAVAAERGVVSVWIMLLGLVGLSLAYLSTPVVLRKRSGR